MEAGAEPAGEVMGDVDAAREKAHPRPGGGGAPAAGFACVLFPFNLLF